MSYLIDGRATDVLVADYGATVTKNAKATPGFLLGISATNRNASVRYLQIHDTATTPAGGATPKLSLPVAPNSVLVVGSDFLGKSGLGGFGSGIAYAWSTTEGTYTAATAADHSTILIGG